MIDPDTFFLEFLIPEEEIKKINEGDDVTARFHTSRSKDYKGHVRRIGAQTIEEIEKVFKVRYVIPVEIQLDQMPRELKYGMHASVQIHYKEKGVFKL